MARYSHPRRDLLPRTSPRARKAVDASGAGLRILGVNLFFAISDLLICGRLLDEEARDGSISLSAFYTRRLFRIQPEAFFYLAFVAIFGSMSVIPSPGMPWLASLFSVRNLYEAAVGVRSVDLYTAHFWSLAIEEHFYLLLPVALLTVRKNRLQVFMPLTFAFLVWDVLMRRITFLHGHESYAIRTDVVMAALLVPSTLALMLRHPMRDWIDRHIAKIGALSGVAILSCMTLLHGKAIWGLCTLCLPLIVLATVFRPRSFVGRFLETEPVRYIGHISYSLYLWQQLFILDPSLYPFAHGYLGAVQRNLPLAFCLTFLAAAASYHLIERPLNRIGHRIAMRLVKRSPVIAEPQPIV